MELYSTYFSPFRLIVRSNNQEPSVLNSRPLSPLSSDPSDFNPLTPEHFLTSNAIASFPEPNTASDSLYYHSRWKLIQTLRNKFLNR
ncbi:integrase catalytic domain-containing protein [Trichonephila clavata]|uniref:Integrase catalytic domain-containing protein n=1 Tax=Trichonephila clavata TaxID=2740835 RepID=A0A8X6K090_TRICU|nr:integrase catalytic domain-containing protein [Trichonephila clavata]